MSFTQNTRRHPKWLGPFRYLTLRHVGWINFKLSLGVWALAELLFTPAAIDTSLQQPILSIWTGTTMFGSIFSIIGVVLGSYPILSRQRLLGLPIELSGLFMTFVGPVIYLTTQASLLIINKEGLPTSLVLHTRLALTIFAYAMVSALVTRLLILLGMWARQNKRQRGAGS